MKCIDYRILKVNEKVRYCGVNVPSDECPVAHLALAWSIVRCPISWDRKKISPRCNVQFFVFKVSLECNSGHLEHLKHWNRVRRPGIHLTPMGEPSVFMP